jgi:hypothetical protein
MKSIDSDPGSGTDTGLTVTDPFTVVNGIRLKNESTSSLGRP